MDEHSVSCPLLILSLFSEVRVPQTVPHQNHIPWAALVYSLVEGVRNSERKIYIVNKKRVICNK